MPSAFECWHWRMFYAIYLCEKATHMDEAPVANEVFHRVVESIQQDRYNNQRDVMIDRSWDNAPGYSEGLDSYFFMQE
jgi:hypothetical protein